MDRTRCSKKTSSRTGHLGLDLVKFHPCVWQAIHSKCIAIWIFFFLLKNCLYYSLDIFGRRKLCMHCMAAQLIDKLKIFRWLSLETGLSLAVEQFNIYENFASFVVEKVPLPLETKGTLTCRKPSEDHANYFNIKSTKARFIFAWWKWEGKFLGGRSTYFYAETKQQFTHLITWLLVLQIVKRRREKYWTVLKVRNTVPFLVTINLFKNYRTMTISIKLREKN